MRCRTGCAAALSAAAVGMVAMPSLANAAGGYVEAYRSSVDASDSTVYAGASDNTKVSVSVARGGAVVAQTPSVNSYAFIDNFVAQAGDEIRVDGPSGRLATYAFDGLPSMDASTCVGSSSFSGMKSAGAELGAPYAYKRTGDPYAPGYSLRGVITTLNGSAFGGTWPSPLTSDYNLSYSQSQPLPGGWTAASYNQAKVPACPVPPPPPLPAPAPVVVPPVGKDVTDPVLTFSLPSASKHGAIKALKAGTFALSFSVNEPGKIKARLGLTKGKKTTTIATSSSNVANAGKVRLKFKLSKAGKKALKKLNKAKLVLTVIATDATGNTTTTKKSFSTTG